MATKIYGTSDDLIEFEGDIHGEVGCYGTDDEGARGVLVVVDDGTLLEVKYGKGGGAIWGITVLKEGPLFDRLEPCLDEDATPYSDVVRLKDGAKCAFAAKSWERVK